MSEFGPSQEFSKQATEQVPELEVNYISRRDFLRRVKQERWSRLDTATDSQKLEVFSKLARLAGGDIVEVTEMPEEIRQAGVRASIREEHFEHPGLFRVAYFETPLGRLYACPGSEGYYRYDLYDPGGQHLVEGTGGRKAIVDAIAELLV